MEEKVLQPTLREKEGARQEPKLNEILGIFDLPFVTIGETGISHLPLPASVSQLLPALAVAERCKSHPRETLLRQDLPGLTASHLYSYVRSVSESRRRRVCCIASLGGGWLTLPTRTALFRFQSTGGHMPYCAPADTRTHGRNRAGGQEMAPGALGCWDRAASRFGRRKSAGCWDLGTSICTPHTGIGKGGRMIDILSSYTSKADASYIYQSEDDLMGLPDWCYVHKHARRAVTLGFKVTATNSSSIPFWSRDGVCSPDQIRGGVHRLLDGYPQGSLGDASPGKANYAVLFGTRPGVWVLIMFGDWFGGILVVVSWSRSAFVKGFERENSWIKRHSTSWRPAR
ncbi:hypothetical protein CCUS01_13229 [Colletotrichum cuscutae]|uniref:Uncharacterized protein n=1 Tax=Colletotrichum cuscutae TaxID=1209917 RepID=A0AAI9YCI7_9PEZI|nr:hypothetical protein CCUS01_13229 [Colletotrichum cuscutae]